MTFTDDPNNSIKVCELQKTIISACVIHVPFQTFSACR